MVVTPISLARETSMRYDEWEYTRRLAVEKAGQSKIGYVHLRAMGKRATCRNGSASFTRSSTATG